MNHNWSATKQRLHLQSVAEINRHSVLLGDRIRQCGTSLKVLMKYANSANGLRQLFGIGALSEYNNCVFFVVFIYMLFSMVK